MTGRSDRTSRHVAHLNVAVLRHDWDDARVAGFTDNLGRVNALAERSSGFVLRLDVPEDKPAPADLVGMVGASERLAWTLSVWRSAEELRHYVHDTVHGAFLRRRAEWFEPLEDATYVIWPVPAGHVPTIEEGAARLAALRAHGPTPAAFDFGYLAEGNSEKVMA